MQTGRWRRAGRGPGRAPRAARCPTPRARAHAGHDLRGAGPLAERGAPPAGSLWRNAFLDVEPAKRKVAETLDEFRGNYRYNLRDQHLRAFNAAVPQIWQWDDHEVVN